MVATPLENSDIPQNWKKLSVVSQVWADAINSLTWLKRGLILSALVTGVWTAAMAETSNSSFVNWWGFQVADASGGTGPKSTISLLWSDWRMDLFQGQDKRLENISPELFGTYFERSWIPYEVSVSFYNQMQFVDAEYGDTFASDEFFKMSGRTQIYTLASYWAAFWWEQKESSTWLVDNLIYLNYQIEALVKFIEAWELVDWISLEELPYPELTLANIIVNFPSVISVLTPAIQWNIGDLEDKVLPVLKQTAAEKAETAAEKAETANGRQRLKDAQFANRIASLYVD